MGLWTSGGTLLASATVFSNSPTFDFSQYVPITPVLLRANSNYIVAGGVPSGFWLWDGFDPGYTSPAINYTGTASANGSSFTFPNNFYPAEPGDGPDIVVANFQYQVTPPPKIQITIQTNNEVAITWPAIIGQEYQLQYPGRH